MSGTYGTGGDVEEGRGGEDIVGTPGPVDPESPGHCTATARKHKLVRRFDRLYSCVGKAPTAARRTSRRRAGSNSKP